MATNTNDEIKLVKAVLLGESGVGKTSIISSFVSKTFSSVLMTTPGATHISKTILLQEENKEIKFEIWDTAGQEKFRSLAKLFYKNAAVIILVYDITRRNSFNEIKKYWYNEVRANASENVLLALVGNKSDMYEYEDITENEAKAYAKSIKAVYKSTSAKNASGIDDLFTIIAHKCIDPQYVDNTTLNTVELKESNKTVKLQTNKTNPQEIHTKQDCKC